MKIKVSSFLYYNTEYEFDIEQGDKAPHNKKSIYFMKILLQLLSYSHTHSHPFFMNNL